MGGPGVGFAYAVAVVVTGAAFVHLAAIRFDEPEPERSDERKPAVDLRGGLDAVRAVPGLLLIIALAACNNLLLGVFMALMDPYGLSLVSVETWGVLFGVIMLSFIAGGLVVSRRGSRPQSAATDPRRQPRQLDGVLVVYPALVDPLAERVFMPTMTDGIGADLIGGWFGVGPLRLAPSPRRDPAREQCDRRRARRRGRTRRVSTPIPKSVRRWDRCSGCATSHVLRATAACAHHRGVS